MCEMLVVFCALGSDISDVSTVMETLRAGVQQWQTEITFRSTFSLRSGYSTSVDAALRGEIDPTIEGAAGTSYEAKGFFHKKGPKIRYAIDFGSPVQVRPSAPLEMRSATSVYKNIPFDETTDGRVVVAYNARRGKLVGRAVVEEKPDLTTLRVGTGKATGRFINPMNPLYGAEWDPFGDLPAVAVNTVDEGHLEVVCFRKDENGNEHHKRVLFWTKPSRPVVKRMELELVRSDGRRFGAYAALSDYKLCPGGYVARQVAFARVVSGGRVPVPVPVRVRVMVWRSEDLGDVPPSDEDFVITIPADVWVTGLKKAPPKGSVRQLDPSKIELSDLEDLEAQDRELRALREGVRPSRNPSGRYVLWGSLAFGVLVVLAVGVRWYAAKRR